MKIPVVDRKQCVGCAVCAWLAPAVFRMDGDRKSVVHDPHGGPIEAVLDAVEKCPVTCITMEEEA